MISWAEEWRDIPGYEGRYQVSNLGRVRSVDHYVTRLVKGRVLRPRIRKEGYPIVTISGKGPVDIHLLVASAFIGKRERGMQVRHLNGDKLDARAENLAYGTQSDNEKDKLRYGGKQKKLTAAQVLEIRKRAEAGESEKTLARDYGISRVSVQNIVKRRTFAWLTDQD